MPGRSPGIHDLRPMPKDVDGRVEPGHDRDYGDREYKLDMQLTSGSLR